MKRTTLSIGLFLLVLVAGCGPVSDNPREGGLAGYWHGTSSGAYEQRQQQRKELLNQEQQANQQLNQRSLALKQERELQDRKLIQEQKQVTSLEKKLNTLKANLGRLKLQSAQQKEEAAALVQQIEQTKLRLDQQKAAIAELDSKGGSSADPDRARVLELERDRLADEYRKLNTYYQALSNAIH